MAAIEAHDTDATQACLLVSVSCEGGRVCQRQTPGEAFHVATYLLRCLVWFPGHAFEKTGKTGKASCSKLSTTVCGTVHTFGTAETAEKTGIAVSESNKTSGTKIAKSAGKPEIYETPETRKTDNVVYESNKNTAGNNPENRTAEIQTGVKNTQAARKTVLDDETGTALTDAITAEPAGSKKIPPRRDGGGAARRHD